MEGGIHLPRSKDWLLGMSRSEMGILKGRSLELMWNKWHNFDKFFKKYPNGEVKLNKLCIFVIQRRNCHSFMKRYVERDK